MMTTLYFYSKYFFIRNTKITSHKNQDIINEEDVENFYKND